MAPFPESMAGRMNDVAACLQIGPSPIHGLGGFARRAIARGTRIVEYAGERIDKAESLRRCQQGNPFIFRLDDEWDLDGSAPSNPARHLNHSCAPNCDAECAGGRLWIVARRDILAGEELTFDYGYDLEDWRSHPCRCGASNCVGYIVAECLADEVLRTGRGRTGEDLGA